MLRRLLTLLTILFTVLIITGCAQNELESTPTVENTPRKQESGRMSVENYLIFDSLEEFLDAYTAEKEGRVPSDWISEHVDFVSLDTLHLPVNLPEEYQLARITVDKYSVSIRYTVDIDENAD